MKKIAFDNDLYLKMQSENILERISKFDNKLYLEFGGKLFDDFHASRVLPGFLPDSKLRMLLTLKDQVEIIIAINANDIEKNKVRSDLGITYDEDTLRLIDAFQDTGLYVGSVVITHYANQPSTDKFCSLLNKLGVKTYYHYPIEGYPSNISHIVSDEGFGKNEYVETERPLVVVTAPGPGSGKMATCLSQLYHEHKRNIKAGYAKYETFPIWNLPLKDAVNLAYEAATADLNDINMIDPFHLEAYNETTVNYNRDVEIFPVLKAMFEKISGESPYKSPTDMGVNMVGYAIIDAQAAQQASKDEIIRRYYAALEEFKKNTGTQQTIEKIELIMSQAQVSIEDRKCVKPALLKAEETNDAAFAFELNDGVIVTGKTSSLLGSASAALLNALKVLAKIDEDIPLISPNIINPIQDLKTNNLGNKNPRLHTDEVLIALAVSATTNPISHKALQQLKKLAGAEAHSTVILTEVDKNVLRKLKINLTSEPQYSTKKLFHK
ncbi:DUF1846 domain-containing protein [Mycoplasma sp. P36-A1]|uniref:DUF1846 domain-containing protein n=1 Tax=Mycoplasma sp. P36-A1 TaxID=3252900 RepID=UPI003C300234